jgi:hypothetical protein
MSMTIDIKHKHASHLIIIEGQAFRANDSGMWDLTDIWRTLKLPKSKQPGQWSNLKEGQYMREMGFSHSAKSGAVTVTRANKRATLAYAGWVSREFETMVYDAFEAILEMPEVALLVADKMRSMGNDHSAAILERHTFSDKCDWSAIKRPHKNTQEGLRAAVARGTITKAWAIELGLKTR